MGNLGVPELLIIGVVIVLLFGSKKLPEMARSLGRSAKILKAETSGLRPEDEPQPEIRQPEIRQADAAQVDAAQVARLQQQVDELQQQLKNAQQGPKPAN
ncbi:Sec-independent protein translocase subunit TatA [Lentzea sp. NPDC004782]|uniref:Sec-independent protein translocase subunit TatA n=1 Tax=Lentzea sp. NPDC004782 TaxID=3154458 RepID=UPI0033A73A66